MARIPRRRLGPGVFHVINRAIDRRWIFSDDDDKQTFLDELTVQAKSSQFTVYHWVIMSNHFHLALEALTVADLSRYLGKVSERYSKYYHQKYGGNGTLWQGRYLSKTVQKQGYLLSLGRYIERNPVRAGIKEVVYPWDYQWSSARSYARNRDDTLVRISDHPYWLSLAETDGKRKATYRRLLMAEQEAAADEAVFRRRDAVIGDKDFMSSIKSVAGRLIARKAGKRHQV